MGKAHQNQEKTAQPKSETNAMATLKKINTINRKQTPIQSSAQTHMDLWNYPPALSIQDSLIHSERTLVRKQSQNP
jgi:hypothetical protein